jgi:hypothetical protein
MKDEEYVITSDLGTRLEFFTRFTLAGSKNFGFSNFDETLYFSFQEASETFENF